MVPRKMARNWVMIRLNEARMFDAVQARLTETESRLEKLRRFL